MQSRLSGATSLIILTLFCGLFSAGCANPGPPKPPTLSLPEPVKDLSAQRVGDRVLLHWTTSARTTDDTEVRRPIKADICREVGTRQATPAARLTACVSVCSVSVTPGASEAEDQLPAALVSGAPVLLTYRIKLENSSGRSAGNSSYAAFAVGGPAPAPISGLRATASERGAILEWSGPARESTPRNPTNLVELQRVDLSAPPAAQKPPAARKEPPAVSSAKKNGAPPKPPAKTGQNEVYLRTSEDLPALTEARGLAGTVDETAEMGDTYTYMAERITKVTVGDHDLELHSAPSQTVTLEMKDIFPPKAPTGLATIAEAPDAAGNGTIDLSWDANTELDLAGYLVYRQLARPDGTPEGPLARLTALPITAPSYRDVAVKAGQRYIYHVTAVDASGNESAPSAKALERVDSPQ